MKDNFEGLERRHERYYVKYIFISFILFFGMCYMSEGIKSLSSDNSEIVGCYLDQGIDADENGLYDFLSVTISVNITEPGEYSLIGDLYDQYDRKLAWSEYHNNFSVGCQDVYLNFDGGSIEKCRINGPYRLKGLTLLFGSSDTNLYVCDDDSRIYNTYAYNYSDFDTSAVTNLNSQSIVISGKGSGEVLLIVSASKQLPVTSGIYGIDLLGVRIPPILSSFDVSVEHIMQNLSGYAYNAEGIYVPSMPNNFSVSASGVKNLNIGLKKMQGDYKNSDDVWTEKYTRVWITSQAIADDRGVAIHESYLISPGIYQAKIFGDAAENATCVNLTMTLVKKIIVNGKFNTNICGIPSDSYSINLKALNGSLNIDELAIELSDPHF